MRGNGGLKMAVATDFWMQSRRSNVQDAKPPQKLGARIECDKQSEHEFSVICREMPLFALQSTYLH